MADDVIKIATSQRSSVESAKEDVSAMVAAVFSMIGANIEPSDGYPGWTPNPNSKILALSARTYEDLFIQKPVIRAIHAGLECGLIGDKYPGMDMVSFGPTIRNPHSPDERLLISTVEKFWKLTVEVLKRVAERN
jgi:dipeptidase D